MESFGELLRSYREACYDPEDPAMKRRLTQERLGELMNYTAQAVSEWERGKSWIRPSERQILVSLLGILQRGGGLRTPERANALLWAGNYRALSAEEVIQVFPVEPGTSVTPSPTTRAEPPVREADEDMQQAWPPGLPLDQYYPLPGREREIDRLVDQLGSTRGPAVVAVDGLGGLGKTALAVELARRALARGLFERVVGDSAKQDVLAGGDIVRVREATLSFGALLDAIIRQLGRWELLTLAEEEKRSAISYLLEQRRYLIFVDNLETAENAGALVVQLRGLLRSSRAVVTSRNQTRHDFVVPLSLHRLDPADTYYFLRADAERRGAVQILAASEHRLDEIHEATGGAPLALKLVVAQTLFLDLKQVLNQLRRAGGQLYPFIYYQSWLQLPLAAQRALIYVGRTVVSTVGWEELSSVGIAAEGSELVEAIDRLIAYSLLEVTVASAELRYGIHPLTRHFVNSDLPEIWRGQAQG